MRGDEPLLTLGEKACRPRSTPTRAGCPSDRSQEPVEGGVGPVAGVSAAWMPRPSPQGRVYGVSRNRAHPASPQKTSFCRCRCRPAAGTTAGAGRSPA
ncbi:hypothetical protein PEM_04590 [Stenotrophomonas sp. Pemsol]|nr:hypothetical protein PEM_04590 [Stenotrophomonas sp. Pemsol]